MVTHAPSKRLQATAYHEAGHAVAAVLLGGGGRRLRTVSIIPDQDTDTLGQAIYTPWPKNFRPDTNEITSRTREKLEAAIMSSYAGSAAEAHFCGRTNWQGSSFDRQTAMHYAEYLVGGPEEFQAYLRWLWLRTRGWVKAPLRWRQIEGVADALLQHRELDGPQVSAAMQAALATLFNAPVVERLNG